MDSDNTWFLSSSEAENSAVLLSCGSTCTCVRPAGGSCRRDVELRHLVVFRQCEKLHLVALLNDGAAVHSDSRPSDPIVLTLSLPSSMIPTQKRSGYLSVGGPNFKVFNKTSQ